MFEDLQAFTNVYDEVVKDIYAFRAVDWWNIIQFYSPYKTFYKFAFVLILIPYQYDIISINIIYHIDM